MKIKKIILYISLMLLITISPVYSSETENKVFYIDQDNFSQLSSLMTEGGVYVFEYGNYSVSDSIYILDDVTLQGNGAVITNTSGLATFRLDQSNIKIDGFKIVNGGAAVAIYAGSNNNIISNNIFQSAHTGVSIAGNNNIIENNQILSTGEYQGNGDGVTIGGNASYNIISNNTIKDGACYGIWIVGAENPNFNVIKNNYISNNATTSVMLNAGKGHTVKNNILINSPSHAVAIEKSKDVIIKDNLIYENRAAGIFVYKDAENVIVSDNISKGNGVGGNLTFGKDIVITSGNNLKNVLVTNNIVGTLSELGVGQNIVIKDNIIAP
ncbi:MAG: right-handed parallel beta-helix repeat-containing protein [Eubacteriales bacterium]|nr:right-handed parallel beta-helix repeat-containing protein [Eubacteriales bacterium]